MARKDVLLCETLSIPGALLVTDSFESHVKETVTNIATQVARASKRVMFERCSPKSRAASAEGVVKEVIYPVVSEETLEDVIREAEADEKHEQQVKLAAPMRSTEPLAHPLKSMHAKASSSSEYHEFAHGDSRW
jgi:hypothetical protein